MTRAERRIPHLADSNLQELNITSRELVEKLSGVFQSAHDNKIWSAPKAVLTPPDGRYVMATLALMDEPPLAVTKSLVLNEENADRGLPSINSLITVLDGVTGAPLATIDGNWITAIRTAGLSALAARHMANPDASSIGFVGCGAQARSHLEVLADLFPLKRVKLSGPGKPNIEKLVALAGARELDAEVCKTPQNAVEDVDIVVSSVTHTSVEAPFLDADALAPGAFAAITDLAAPWRKETFDALDRLAVDDLTQESAASVKLANPGHISGDLMGLVVGAWRGREKPGERTAFVFRGHALGDLALSALAYEKAKDDGQGA